jgi:hypothetical protein
VVVRVLPEAIALEPVASFVLLESSVTLPEQRLVPVVNLDTINIRKAACTALRALLDHFLMLLNLRAVLIVQLENTLTHLLQVVAKLVSQETINKLLEVSPARRVLPDRFRTHLQLALCVLPGNTLMQFLRVAARSVSQDIINKLQEVCHVRLVLLDRSRTHLQLALSVHLESTLTQLLRVAAKPASQDIINQL